MSGGLSTINTNPQQLQIASDLGVLQKDISQHAKTLVEQINSSSIGNIPPANNQPNVNQTAAQNLTQQNKASTSVFDSTMMGRLENSLNGVTNSSQRVGDQQSTQMLEEALQSNNTAQHTEQPKSVSQSATDVSATPSTTITKEIASGQHPHLDEEISTEVQKIINHTPPKNEHVDEFIESIKKHEKFLKKGINGEYPIDFKQLGISKEDIKEAGIEGKIFKNAKGEFDFKITGKCSPATVKCLRVLKQKLESIRNHNPDFKTIEINIEPNTAGPLNANDLKVLENHGLIKYKIITDSNNPSENQIMKLILDPGKDEKDDGLTVETHKGIYNPDLTTKLSKIPLKVVFEGDKFNERPGIKPLLPNWRNVFELSSSSREAQSILWTSVDTYLKASVEITKGHHDTDNEVKSLNIQTNEQNKDLSSTSNTSTSGDLENATTINENPQDIVGKEENTQQQAPTINSLETNTAVDINKQVIVSKQGEIYSNQLQVLSEKAKQGNLAQTDIEDFRKNLPAPVQSYLNNYLNVNNIKSISMDVLRLKFENLTSEECQKIGHAIAQANTSQNPKSIQAESKSIEYNQALNIDQTIDNGNEETTEDGNINKHFKQLDEKFAEIKNSIPEDEYKNLESQYQNYKSAIKAYAKRPNKSKNFSALLSTLSTESMNIKETENLLDAAKSFAKVMKFVTEELKTISDFEDLQDKKTTIIFEELKGLTGVAKQVIGQTIFADLAKGGINTANEKDTEMVDELIKFHEKHQEHATYDALLTAFIKHKKSEVK